MKRKNMISVFLACILFLATMTVSYEVRATKPTVQTLTPTNITSTSLTIRGIVNPNGKSTRVFYRIHSGGAIYGSELQEIGSGTSPVPVSYNWTTILQPGRTYKCQVNAVNADGTTYGNQVEFTTPAGIVMTFIPMTIAPTTPVPLPPKVTTLSATEITQTSAKLRANVNPEGLSTTVDFCSCDLSGSPSFFYCKHAATQTGTGTREVSITLSGLEAGRTYKYVAQAQNSAGNRSGMCVTFGTSPAMTVMTFIPLGAKPIVSTLEPTNVTGNGATLRGTVNGNNLETSYTFVSCNPVGNPAYFLPAPPKSIGSGPKTFSVSYNLLNLSLGRVYSYKIQATNSAGTSTGSCVNFLTPAIIGPTMPPLTYIPTTTPPVTMIPTVIPPTYLPPGTAAPQNQPPTAVAGSSKSAMVGDIVSFDGSASSDPDGNVLTYLWDFGDGQTGSGANSMHTYNTAGNYAVSLTVSDGQYSDTAYAQVTVQEKQGAGFSFGGDTTLYAVLGVVALLLVVLIAVMLSRGGKQPPRIYRTR